MLKDEQAPTWQIIQEKVRIAVLTTSASKQGHPVEIDQEKLVGELKSLFNTRIGIGTVLDNPEDHIP